MRVDTSFAHSPGTAISDGLTPTGGAGRNSHSVPSIAVPAAGSATLQSLCATIVTASFSARKLPARGELEAVRSAAEKLARQGVALREVQRAVHATASSSLKSRVHSDGSADGTGVVDDAVFMMHVFEHLGNAVSSAYIDHCRQDSKSTRERAGQLVEMLAAGDPEARIIAERNGIDIASEYEVVVVKFVETTAGPNNLATRSIDNAAISTAMSSLAPVSAESGTLLSLTNSGGIVLVPSVSTSAVEDVLAALHGASGVETVAATARASVEEISDVAAHCRELVELARSLRMKPGLYRTGDLALEYQLSRPGPGRSRLRSVIAPLDAYPELLHTLRTFVSTEANRRASAKSLYVHPNTVDYRLKRIEQLTGVDPLSSAGLMALHAALVVDCLARAGAVDVPQANVVARAS